MKPLTDLNRRFHVIGSIALILFLFSISVQAQEIITLRVVSSDSELTEAEIANFEEANPDIRIELIDWNGFSYDTAVALGEIPDILRVQATDMPQLVRDGILLDLTPYFEASDLIQIDDLANATDYYLFDGRYYGLPKDWSLDFSLYIYVPAFEAAGIPIPDTDEPLTYAELASLAQQLTIKDGNTVTQYGFYTYFLERAISSILTQRGLSLFNEDYTEMNLINNPEALEVVRYFYDMVVNDTMYADTDGMWGLITGGKVAIFQYGYWFGGAISEEDAVYNHLIMLPAPTWSHELPRMNTTIGPTGIAIPSLSEHPDEAYRFFEWYTVGEAGIDRTIGGWGAPVLLSMFDLLPHDTESARQRLDVLRSELPYSDWILPIYPYQSITTTFIQSWLQNIQLARTGEIDFDTFASNIQEAVNLAILDEQLGL